MALTSYFDLISGYWACVRSKKGNPTSNLNRGALMKRYRVAPGSREGKPDQPKLLEQMRTARRVLHNSIHTERKYF